MFVVNKDKHTSVSEDELEVALSAGDIGDVLIRLRF